MATSDHTRAVAGRTRMAAVNARCLRKNLGDFLKPLMQPTNMIRKLLAVVLGAVAGSILNMALVQVSHTVYPLPENVDPSDLNAFRAHVAANGLPAGALLIVLLAHAGGSFLSGLVCGLIARRRWYLAAIILGLLWTCSGIAMLTILPAPIWFATADLLLYVPAALAGVVLGGTFTGGKAATQETGG